MERYAEYKFAAMYRLKSGSTSIECLCNLVDWTYSVYLQFLDGERTFCTLRNEGGIEENVVILQIGSNMEGLEETKIFCNALKKDKHLSLEMIRTYFKPVRQMNKRQSLPPIDVSKSHTKILASNLVSPKQTAPPSGGDSQ